MHVHLRRAAAVAFLAAAAAVLGASCVPNDSSFFIGGCVQVARDTCTADLSTTSVINFEGTIDAAFAGEYTCLLLIENQMVPQGNPTTLRTETDGLQLYQAEVQILDPTNDNAVLAEYSVPITGYIPPGSGGTPGIGGTDVILLDPVTLGKEKGLAAKTLQQVVSSVILHGQTLGGVEVSSGVWQYPITIADGQSCAAPSGSTCVSSTAVATADCRLGLDEPGGTNCQLLNPCAALHCTTKGDTATAQCPTVAQLGDGSCCAP